MTRDALTVLDTFIAKLECLCEEGDAPLNGNNPTLTPEFWSRLPRGNATWGDPREIIERVVFDSADYPVPERAGQYQHLLASPARATSLIDPFRAHVVIYNLGDVQISLSDGVPHRFERSRAKVAFDRIDRVVVQHVVSGHVVGAFDGNALEAGEGAVYGVDLARPAMIEEKGQMRSISLSLKRPAAAALLPGIDRMHGALLDRRTAEPYLRQLYSLISDIEALSATDASQRSADLLLALARCFERVVQMSDRHTDKRQAVLDFIDVHLADRRLTPDFIATSLKMSRSALFAIFRDAGGVERAVVERRLVRAHTVLVQSEHRSTMIQLSSLCGFSSPEYFARAFRKRFGSPPSRYKAEKGQTECVKKR